MIKDCPCGQFQFVTDKPLEKPVEAKCPKCGTKTTLQPEKPVKAGKKEADS